MKAYHKNPRKISDSTLQALKYNIIELGDLSGITHDLNTGEILTGNQRSKIISIDECEIIYVEKYDEPNAQGTVAIGYVKWEEQYLNYREVRWNDEQREKANITANALGGDFDHKLLAEFNIGDLRNWNVRPEDIKKLQEMEEVAKLDYGEPKYSIVPKMSEKYNYVVILATNEIDLAYLENFFSLKMEQSYKNSKVGVGRVVTFEKFKSLIDNARNS